MAKQLKTFRLLRGEHHCTLNGKLQSFFSELEGRNLIVTDEDLVKKLGRERVQLLDYAQSSEVETAAVGGEAPETDLKGMTVGQLKEVAVEEQIDISTAANKAEILAMLEAALGVK